MLRDSVAEPQETADRLLSLRPSTGVILQAAVLVSVLDALLLGLLGGGSFVVPTPQGELALSPIWHAVVLFASLVLSAGALQVGGQMLGGKGRFQESLLLVVWLEVLAIAIQVVTLLVALILPPVAGILGFLGLGILIWCIVHFARALHGFAGYGRTIGALLLGAVVVVVGISALLAMLGFGGPPNV
jgi:hypothetical protein